MSEAILNQFLTRYETADTRREKALAIYNAVKVAVPFQELHKFLGSEDKGFLSFIKTMQDEDSDVSTAIAREEDAPRAEYLEGLYNKLKALQ